MDVAIVLRMKCPLSRVKRTSKFEGERPVWPPAFAELLIVDDVGAQGANGALLSPRNSRRNDPGSSCRVRDRRALTVGPATPNADQCAMARPCGLSPSRSSGIRIHAKAVNAADTRMSGASRLLNTC